MTDPDNRAPFTLTITSDLWAWTFPEAVHLQQQIVEAFEKINSERNGGIGTHHQVTLSRIDRAKFQ